MTRRHLRLVRHLFVPAPVADLGNAAPPRGVRRRDAGAKDERAAVVQLYGLKSGSVTHVVPQEPKGTRHSFRYEPSGCSIRPGVRLADWTGDDAA